MKQMLVGAYLSKFVASEDEPKFMELMSQWDGSTDSQVYWAFYDMDVLRVKHHEAQQWREQH